MDRNLSVTNRFPQESRLPAALWTGRYTAGTPGAAAHFHDFLPDLSAAFCPVCLQKEMVPLLQGFCLRRKCDALIPNLVTFQLVPADFIIHDRHIERILCELLERHSNHPAPAGSGSNNNCQAAQNCNCVTFFHLTLSSTLLSLPES